MDTNNQDAGSKVGKSASSTPPALPPEVIRRLSQIDARRGSIHVLTNVFTAVLLFGLGVWFWNPLVLLLLVIAMAGPQHGFLVLAHEATHYRLFNRRWLNELVGTLCGAVVGVNLGAYRAVHLVHHRHLYQPIDPDLPLMAGYPRGKRYLLAKLLRDLSGRTAYKTYAYFFGNPIAQNPTAAEAITDAAADPLANPVASSPTQAETPASQKTILQRASQKIQQRARIDRAVVLGVQLTLLLIAWGSGLLLPYLILWVLPLLTTLQALLRIRAILEHGAPKYLASKDLASKDLASKGINSPLTAARTNYAPRWLNWWLFPHHVNYHIEHHLYPSIPCYHLPEAHALLSQRGILQDADVRPVRETLARVFAPKKPHLSQA